MSTERGSPVDYLLFLKPTMAAIIKPLLEQLTVNTVQVWESGNTAEILWEEKPKVVIYDPQFCDPYGGYQEMHEKLKNKFPEMPETVQQLGIHWVMASELERSQTTAKERGHCFVRLPLHDLDVQSLRKCLA